MLLQLEDLKSMKSGAKILSRGKLTQTIQPLVKNDKWTSLVETYNEMSPEEIDSMYHSVRFDDAVLTKIYDKAGLDALGDHAYLLVKNEEEEKILWGFYKLWWSDMKHAVGDSLDLINNYDEFYLIEFPKVKISSTEEANHLPYGTVLTSNGGLFIQSGKVEGSSIGLDNLSSAVLLKDAEFESLESLEDIENFDGKVILVHYSEPTIIPVMPYLRNGDVWSPAMGGSALPEELLDMGDLQGVKK